MPKRTDIQKILIIGSGPIVIGQACEFDYSGTQACKVLRSEGYSIVLVNSNPATIMTDPELADRTYIEPLTPEYLENIILEEKPDALLPTVGGQTALNLAVALSEQGILDKQNVELIGAQIESIKIGENRLLFKEAMQEISLDTPQSGVAYSFEEARKIVNDVGYPAIIRPSFTLGGTGGGIAYNAEEFESLAQKGLTLSPANEILIEESVIGWKEFELEVMRDLKDNVVIVCSIENIDPMGVHTGDSITVAPIQTLTDKEYQYMRNAAIQVIRKVGVETGGANIQFAVNPQNGHLVVIEMNPRVSRSSALASKATGFPIAKIAAKLAVGFTLDEIPNDITKKTPACFEPTIDYVVTKIPKWAFEKFPEAQPILGTQMKSVGEVMAIGRTIKESLLKAIRSLETGRKIGSQKLNVDQIKQKLITPNPDRLLYLRFGFEKGLSLEKAFEYTRIDPWFLRQIQEISFLSLELRGKPLAEISQELLWTAKRTGMSDQYLAWLTNSTAIEVQKNRISKGIIPVYKQVDTCAAEFESFTPYLYSVYEEQCEAEPTQNRKIVILGSGPNRIGQGIEFDYCCCHASFALKEDGWETIMVNCNPETVSTDYDTSDRLYFEPLTLEDVMHIVNKEKPNGVIVQFGGQTPLTLALALQEAGVPIVGTSPGSIDLAEDRKRFGKLLKTMNIPQPPSGTATSFQGAVQVAGRVGYPVLVRPSYVLGGRAMVIVHDDKSLERYMAEAVGVSQDRPILIDKFLEDAFEVDVDVVADGEKVVIGGIMEHIEEAGIHSGDSSCVLPTYMVKSEHLKTMRGYTIRLAQALKVIGLMNVQYAIKDDVVYVLEVNPRASRTIPFVSKATGIPLAKIAASIMTGRKLSEFNLPDELPVDRFFVKSPVFPFLKFPGVDTILGPEMKSTGEVMGVADTFGLAYAKAQLSAGVVLPSSGTAFISVNDRDKQNVIDIAKRFYQIGFKLVATSGTQKSLLENGISVEKVYKVNEGRPNVVDLIKSGQVNLILNTPLDKESFFDERAIRRSAIQYNVPCITTLSGGAAVASGISALKLNKRDVRSIQEYHASSATAVQ